ncbi:hypothetical protein B0H10DRAFT_1946364 [Mycena sp. CBHHK59/15]|nr:hypothetical protein B0H10DRAFT_1946364 [Mycena sp. CBHHK59/15]
MGNDSDSGDQLDDFIHAYSYSDYNPQSQPPSDEEDASCSDSGSEPPEDSSAEAEDMAIYDLYDNSTRPSPQPPASPLLHDAGLPLNAILEDITEDGCQRPERRKRAYIPHGAFAPHGCKNDGDATPTRAAAGDSSESGIESSEESEDSHLTRSGVTMEFRNVQIYADIIRIRHNAGADYGVWALASTSCFAGNVVTLDVDPIGAIIHTLTEGN